MVGGAGRDAGAQGQVGKSREVSLRRVESAARVGGVTAARAALRLERGVRTQSFGRERGKGLGMGLQRAQDLVLGC